MKRHSDRGKHRSGEDGANEDGHADPGAANPKRKTGKEKTMKKQEKNTRPEVGRGGALAVKATRKAEKEKRPVKMKGKDLRCGK